VVTGSTDAVGTAAGNLRLSQQRAGAVLRGLVARGIPTERFQILAKGVTEPPVPTTSGAAEPRNRRAELTWR
jgi:outer membrane protein OmpA-like peptidoglycan-associated protein